MTHENIRLHQEWTLGKPTVQAPLADADGSLLYDLDLNSDRDRITLYRKNRAAHRWTRAEAEHIKHSLESLIPKMIPNAPNESKR